MAKVCTVQEMWPIDKVRPYELNSKVHTPEQVEKLANIIGDQGWDQPIVVDKAGVIIKGHGRRLAAIHLGMKEVPVVVRDDLSPEQVRLARIADNRVALGEIDEELLRKELASLASLEIDLSLSGFDSNELEFLNADTDALLDELLSDDVPSKGASTGTGTGNTAPSAPEEQEYKEAFQVIVEVGSEEEQEKVYNEMTAKGYKCRILSI